MTPPAEPATFREAAYDRAIRGLRRASALVNSRVGSVIFDEASKVSTGIRGRREAAAALVAWGEARRDPKRPIAWFHAPSVGEGLQARAVMEALLELCPEIQLVFTFFSPSARALAARMPARVAAYLPWDSRDEMDPVLDALQPAMVVFTKTEVWPGLSGAAERRGIPTALVAATLPDGAKRLRWPAPHLLRPAFGRLERIGAISKEDGRRFARLGVDAERVTVTGDPGIDSACRRVADADPDASFLAPFHPVRSDERPTLVAGSTWGPDEHVLLPAFVAARKTHPALRLIVAPHEPEPAHLGALEARLRREGLSSRRLAAVEAAGDIEGIDVVVVDRVGVLAHLYTVGTFAYVGGGHHRHGLHSVIEPAAAGLPVIFGPRHANSRAASDLLDRKAAAVARSPDELAGLLRGWLNGPLVREDAARAALSYISEHRGAARETAGMLLALMEHRRKGKVE